jgi:RNA polymerase sigma-70 factor, ECF subfamily
MENLWWGWMAESAAGAHDRELEREQAFRRLVSRELATAYRTAALLLGDAAEAEDATQDALLRAWQRWDQLKDGDRAGAWFGRILVNVCRDRLRRPRPAPVRWIADRPVPDAVAATAERDALRGAFDELNPDQRIAVVLRYDVDLPIDAIAARTGVSEGTVKSRLHHGLRILRAAYEAQERTGEEPDA